MAVVCVRTLRKKTNIAIVVFVSIFSKRGRSCDGRAKDGQ